MVTDDIVSLIDVMSIAKNKSRRRMFPRNLELSRQAGGIAQVVMIDDRYPLPSRLCKRKIPRIR
jgi:hypothetical protein